MKKTVLIFFALVISLNVFSQMQRQGRRAMNNIPQTNREPTEQDIAKRKRMIEERKDEYITNFIDTPIYLFYISTGMYILDESIYKAITWN